MRRFLSKFAFIVFLFFILQILFFIVKIGISHNVDWRLANNPTTIFLGASHIESGINPDYYASSVNLSSASERYMFTYLKLKKIVDYNQIDTLFLQFAPTDVWEHTDCKYFAKDAEMLHFIPLYSPLFSKDEYKVYARDFYNFINILAKKMFSNFIVDINSYGGYKINDKIFNSKKQCIMPNWDVSYGSDINLGYLNKILNLCDLHKIKVYLIYIPMFKPNQFYDQDYYYSLYNKYYLKYELLDYSSLNIPDEYRADEHHLNKDGAIYFTKLLYNDIHK